MSIFKAYDIRGVYPGEINEDAARRIGAATARFLKTGAIVVGRDMRVSSDNLADALVAGILETGTNVLDIGVVSTPMVYFAIGSRDLGGGIMVTASHNPAKYNGFKISREKAIPLSSETGLADIEKLAGIPSPPAPKPGKRETAEILPDYAAHVLRFARDIRPLTVVIDAGNGMAGKILPPILAKLPLKVTPLYFELDGRFPHHEANPLKPENLEDLRGRVRAEKADLGVAFDGDGDRVAFVDEGGGIIASDLITALIAREFLAREKGAAVLYDLRSSRVVAEEIRKGGGIPVQERVGHAFMKATLRKRNAVFGGELSGHYYFRDNYCADSGALAMMMILNALSAAKAPLSALIAPLRRYSASGEINFEVADKAAAMDALEKRFRDGTIIHLDGVTVEYPDWWFNVRASNTEPLLRLNLEADTPEKMKKGLEAVCAVLGKPGG
ncbi:MAG: phosphomannomutase/phosphoglucomutase [Planctomycetota bacterium]